MQQGVVLLLVSSLLAMVWPSDGTRATSDSHADWLRSQVRVTLDESEQAAFEAALQSAADTQPGALPDFLRHFVDTYVQQDAGLSLATVLGLSGDTHQHVLNELQRRIAQQSGWALAPRPTVSLKAAVDGTTSLRTASPSALLADVPGLVAHRVHRLLSAAIPMRAVAQHTLSPARPRAP
jgi:hypothetical protein